MLLVEILNEGDVVDLAQRRAIKKRKNLEPTEKQWIVDFVTGSLLGSGASPEITTKLGPILARWIERQIDYAIKHSPYARERTSFIRPTKTGSFQAGERLQGIMRDLIFFLLHNEMNDLKNLFNIDERTMTSMVKKAKEKIERKSRLKLVKPNAMVDLDGPEALTPEIDDRRDAGRERDGYSLPLPP